MPSETADPAEATVVALTPMTADHLRSYLDLRLSAEGTGQFQWFGFKSPAAIRRRFEEDGCIGPDGGLLSVMLAAEWAGTVEWFPGLWGPAATSRCWTIAIGIVPALRGRGIGTQAQRLLARYLFDHTRAERIQAWTDVANLAEQRSLSRAGFHEEGTLRRAQWRGGAWHDQKIYSRLRED